MGLLKTILKAATKPITNNIKGKIGEGKVNRKLNNNLFDNIEHKLIKNLILKDEHGGSHQIDHIEIRNNGIFCIETKNYIGLILGNESQDKWTQVLYTGQKNNLINPLKQNKSHVYHIKKVLDDKYEVNSLVVMVQNNADKIAIPNVINLKDLKYYLKNYNDGTYLSSEEIENIYNILLNAKSEITEKEHVKNIKRTQVEIDSGKCPRCGGNLIIRNGKYGSFKGCSNYPKCRFVLKYNE